MNILQCLYILLFNNTLKLTSRLSKKTRDYLVFGGFVIISINGLLYLSGNNIGLYLGLGERMIFGCLALLMIAVFSVGDKLEKVKWNPIIFYPYMLLSVIMLVNTFFFDVGLTFSLMALMNIFVWPCIIFIWNNKKEDYPKYFIMLAKSIVLIAIVFALLTVIFDPLTVDPANGRFSGFSEKPTRLGFYCTIVTAATLYLLVANKNKWNILYGAMAATYITIGVITGTRTVLLVFFTQFLVFVILFFRSQISRKIRKTIAIILISVLAVGAVTTGTIFFLDSKQSETGENLDLENTNAIARILPKEMSLDSFSSGRLTIWKDYWGKIRIVGNDGITITTEKGKEPKSAHLAPLEMAYRFGIPGGILYCFFMISIGVICLKELFNKKRAPIYIFISLTYLAYTITSLLDVVLIPFDRFPAAMLYLCLLPIFTYGMDKKQQPKLTEDLLDGDQSLADKI